MREATNHPFFCPVCLQKKFVCSVCLQKKSPSVFKKRPSVPSVFKKSPSVPSVFKKKFVCFVLFDFCQVDAVVLFYLSHDEGALDGADGLDVAEFREYELLVLFHIACANL